MNHPGHHPYPSSSSHNHHHHHRPNPTHPHFMVGHNQRLGRNARRIEHVPGGFIFCGAGMFTGRTIRAEVVEVQKANVGRKYAASKDRRALDPPPVAGLRIFDVRDTGNGMTQETEIDYRGVQPTGLICHVEAFQVQMAAEENPAHVTDFPILPSANPSYPQHTPNGHRVEAYFRNQPLTLSTNHTGSLVGDLFTQALNLPIGQNGENTLLFVFADLSVQMEGWFLFRYRVFDLFSVHDNNGSQPILAECWGSPFKIYATKQFPGLEPSTELTKLLHSHHVPVRAREVRRKRKKNSNNESSADSDQDRGSTP